MPAHESAAIRAHEMLRCARDGGGSVAALSRKCAAGARAALPYGMVVACAPRFRSGRVDEESVPQAT